MTMRAKRYQNSAALLIFMRRTFTPHSSLDSEVDLHTAFGHRLIHIRGEAATFIPNSSFLIPNFKFSFKQSFRTRSRDGKPHTYYQRTNE